MKSPVFWRSVCCHLIIPVSPAAIPSSISLWNATNSTSTHHTRTQKAAAMTSDYGSATAQIPHGLRSSGFIHFNLSPELVTLALMLTPAAVLQPRSFTDSSRDLLPPGRGTRCFWSPLPEGAAPAFPTYRPRSLQRYGEADQCSPRSLGHRATRARLLPIRGAPQPPWASFCPAASAPALRWDPDTRAGAGTSATSTAPDSPGCHTAHRALQDRRQTKMNHSRRRSIKLLQSKTALRIKIKFNLESAA